MAVAAAPSLDPAKVASLGARFAGVLLGPGHLAYDAARAVWNGMIDRRPALIARCTGVADVIAAIAFAREHDLLVAVRGGGHNVSGNAVCDGGLVIDLTPMKGVRVDPHAKRVRVQGGVNWGEVYRETQAYGLAFTGGIVTTTGVTGLTLGGGIGWLMRKHGLTVDALRSADVVTVDGRILVADAEREPELFWALRGGGGNFGVVTSFEFEVHELGPTVLAGAVLYPAEEAGAVLRRYRDVARTAADEVATIFTLRRVPPTAMYPADLHGRKVIAMNMLYAGAPDRGERELRPLRTLGTALFDNVRCAPYTTLQSMFDAGVPWGMHYYWKSHYFADLTDAIVDLLAERAWTSRSPTSYSILFHMGGAVARVPADATPFGDRSMRYAINMNAAWADPAHESDIEWTRGMFDALRPHATGGVYVNFLGNEGDERVRDAYRTAQTDRLARAKARYDPTNVLRLNQNIRPA